MKSTGGSAAKYVKAKELIRRCWTRFVYETVSFANKPIAEKNPETSADRASRRTAFSTGIIALFTAALVGVGYVQYVEIRDSGVESSGQMNQMIQEYRSQVAQLKKQAGDTHELAQHMKDQADRTKTIADQAITQATEATIAANAAKSAAETADKALHISERAYIVVGLPGVNTTTKYITLPILNTGHMPSGKVSGIVHEVTIDGVDPTATVPVRVKPTESHWKHYELASIPTTGQTMNINVPVPALDVGNLNTGHKQIVVVGIITYSDGFPDDPDQQWPFCEGSALLPMSKNPQWVVCDPALYLPEAIQEDHYPNNEYPN